MYDEPQQPLFKPAREIALVNLNSSVFIRSDNDKESTEKLLSLGMKYLREIKSLESEK